MSKVKKSEEPVLEEVREEIVVEAGQVGDLQTKTLPRKIILILVIVAIVAIIAFINKGLLLAAMVNNTPITRFSIISELEKTSGKKTLESVITKTLILQEASKEKVSVTKEEVASEMKKIEDSVNSGGQKFDDVLALQGITKAQLEEQIRLQKLIEKILSKTVSVSDKEVTDYIASNSATMPKDIKPEDANTQAREALTQEKMQEKFTPWLEALRTKAKINYFVSY